MPPGASLESLAGFCACGPGAVTDSKGVFKITAQDAGPYLLSVSFVGYKKFVQRVASSVEENITLIPDDLMLDEVVITQRLPQFRLDNGG